MSNLLELLTASFSLPNLAYTVLLLIMLVYWLSVIVGALDIEALDFDLDTDFDADMDLDGELDADVGAEGLEGTAEPSALRSFLRFFNIGEVPATVILSFFITSLWAVGVLSNHYLHRSSSPLLGLAVFVPNVVVSLFVAKYLSMPFRAMFRALDSGSEDSMDLVGKTCVITTSKATPSFGQAEVRLRGAPLLLTVRTDGETLAKGDEAVVMDVDKERGVYTVSKLELEV